jgi:hypothetical protein
MNNEQIIKILPIIMTALTPIFREAFRGVVGELEQKADETKSPVDNAFVKILKGILDIQ